MRTHHPGPDAGEETEMRGGSTPAMLASSLVHHWRFLAGLAVAGVGV
jgi:hypothetical protein